MPVAKICDAVLTEPDDPDDIPLRSSVRATHAAVAHVLSVGGSPYPTNYGAMTHVLDVERLAYKTCGVCDGMGAKPVDPQELELRQYKLATFDRDIAATDSDQHAERLKRARREYMETWLAESVCPACEGTGHVEHKSKISVDLFATQRCFRCSGVGHIERRGACFRCLHCDGRGYWWPVNAKPTRGRKPGNSWSGRSATDDAGYSVAGVTGAIHAPDEQCFVEFGRVLRILGSIESARRAAIVAYFGPEGARWATHSWSRLFVLWPHTASGQQIYEGRSNDDWLLSAIDYLERVRVQAFATKIPDFRMRVLLRQADSEARTLQVEIIRLVGEVGL